jgi:alpha-glucoside transport system permease protein
MLLPAAILVGGLVAAPLLTTVAASVRVRGARSGVGVNNYIAVLTDAQARHAIANSLRWLLLVAPLVCLVGFVLGQVGRNSYRSRALLIGVIAAPVAVSGLVSGMAFRLMSDPQPDRGVLTAVLSTAQHWLGRAPVLPGAGPAGPAVASAAGSAAGSPAGSVVEVDNASGDLVTADPLGAGQAAVLALTGVPTPAASPFTGTLPPLGAGEVVGAVTVDGRLAPGVPVVIRGVGGSDFTTSGRTGADGTVRFDVSQQSPAQYQLRIPAWAIARPSATTLLGPGSIGWVLGSAFAWSWAGFAVVVFRAGLAGIPRDLLRMARAYGAGRLRRAVSVYLPALVPVVSVVLLTLLVAAARVFELVLVGAPGSVQADADVVGVHWWRFQGLLGAGGAAALVVLPFLVVAGLALAALVGLNREWPRAAEAARTEPGPARSRARRWLARTLGLVAATLWLVPFLDLLATSLRSPRDAATAGWWARGHDGPGLESYRVAFASGELGGSLLTTAVRAVLATSLVLVLAAPAAHALAGGRLSRNTERVLVAVTAVLAVVPVPTVAGPLGATLDWLHLSGQPGALALVHAALGVPFAVLLLRPAFRAAQDEPLERVGLGDRGGVAAVLTVAARSWTTVLAVAVLEFVLVWNDMVVALLVGSAGSYPVTLVLYEQARELATSAGVISAGAVVSLAVPLALVLATGRWVVRGLTAGLVR